MKKLLITTLILLSIPSFAQNILTFPDNIHNYQKKENIGNQTTLQLVLFDKQKFQKLNLSQEDLVLDSDDLTNKISDYFKPIMIDKTIQEKTKKGKKITKTIKEEKSEKGYLLITKYVFLSKDNPYQLEVNEDNEDLQQQLNKVSQCKEGICTSHIIMGINYFDIDLKIKPLDIKAFTEKLSTKDEKMIRANKNSETGILKIYYFYGINGTLLPQNKEIIKNLVQESKK